MSLLELEGDALKVYCAAVLLDVKSRTELLEKFTFNELFWSVIEALERRMLVLNYDSKEETFWIGPTEPGDWDYGDVDIEALKLKIGPVYRELRQGIDA